MLSIANTAFRVACIRTLTRTLIGITPIATTTFKSKFAHTIVEPQQNIGYQSQYIEIEQREKPVAKLRINAERDETIFATTETRVSQILEHKEHVYTINESATIFEAITKMTRLKLGALLVTNKLGGLTGIISERDYMSKVVLHGFSSKTMLVESIMAPRPYFICPEFTARACLDIMTKHRFRHLPVCTKEDYIRAKLGYEDDFPRPHKLTKTVDLENPTKPVRPSGEKLVPIGIVSIGDCVKAVIEEQQYSLRVLKEYTTDRGYSVPKDEHH